jgi:Zn-dependent peptidase ImmA (M78 family)
MPRPWVTQAFRSGVQEPAVLASRFGVSHAAMNYRLAQIGLVDPRSRCRLPDRSWRQVRTGQASDLRYQRPSHEGPATRSVQPWTQPKSTPRRPGSSALWPQ